MLHCMFFGFVLLWAGFLSAYRGRKAAAHGIVEDRLVEQRLCTTGETWNCIGHGALSCYWSPDILTWISRCPLIFIRLKYCQVKFFWKIRLMHCSVLVEVDHYHIGKSRKSE